MISIELGVAITILTYLVIVTSYIVSLRKDINTLKENFVIHSNHLEDLKQLREDFIRLETKIEILLNLPKEKEV
jgi:Tfp pilus assembly protein PilO